MFFFKLALIILLSSLNFMLILMCQTGKYGLRNLVVPVVSSPLERLHPPQSPGLHNPAQRIPILSSGEFMQFSLNYGNLT